MRLAVAREREQTWETGRDLRIRRIKEDVKDGEMEVVIALASDRTK